MSKKVCPSCGKMFNCEADQDCWCEQAQVHKREMVIIMDRYDDCLCPECLERYSER